MTVLDIPIEHIVIGDNDRKTYTGIEELAQSIADGDPVPPITVRPLMVGQYEIVYGHRRYFAHKHLGRTTIEANVCEMDDRQALRVMWLENEGRVQLNPIEQALALAKRKEQLRLDNDEQLAHEVNRAPSFVRDRLSLLTLNDHVRHLVATGQLKIGFALAMIGLDTNRQSLAVTALTNKMSVNEFAQLCGKLAADQAQESLFDLSSFMTDAIEPEEPKPDRPEMPGNLNYLPRVPKGSNTAAIIDGYIQELRKAGLKEGSEAVEKLYIHLLRNNYIKPKRVRGRKDLT